MDRNRSSFLPSAFTRGAGLLTSWTQRHQTLGGGVSRVGGCPTQVCWSSVQSPGHIIRWHVNYSSQFTLVYAPREGPGVIFQCSAVLGPWDGCAPAAVLSLHF